MNKKSYVAIGLLSASIIAFQLALMQILSISQWSHFAYMVISVALLGFGASGTFLSFTGKWLRKHIRHSLPVLFLLCSASMGLIMHFSGLVFGGFDSYLLFLDRSHVYGLITSYMLLFIPFFFGGTAIGLVYMHHVSSIGKLYFADLFGSAVGGLMMLLFFWILLPQTLPFAIALLPFAGALLLPKAKRQLPLTALYVFVFVVHLAGFFHTPALPVSQYKSITRTLLLPDAEIIDRKISPYGKLELVSASSLRYAPGLSLTYTGEVPVRKALFNNGNWFGPVMDFNTSDSSFFLDFTTNALPFVIAGPSRVLVAEAGTGMYALHALSNGAKQVTAVEPNSMAVKLLKAHAILPGSGLHFVEKHPRSYLMADTSRYDLIILPIIEAFGGSSGINALQEQYLFTLEAFSEMWDRLSPDGMIAVTVWMDFPLRNVLKMAASLVQTAENKSIEQAGDHLAAIRSWGTVTFILKKSPLQSEEIDLLKSFCQRMNFDPLLFPGIGAGERMHYNQLQDNEFFGLLDQLLHGDRESLFMEYDFQLRPATDSKPYFSQFLKLSRLGKMQEIFGQGGVPFLEVGYLIVLLTLVQITIVALLLIIAPLFILGFRGGGKLYTLAHFSGIGIGFMFVEIILIQQLTLFFGHPIYAAAAVLSGMLLFSGAGAYVSGKLVKSKRQLAVYLMVIVLFILLLSVFLMPLLRMGISQPLPVKLAISVLLIGPLAFLMGLPFPSGLRFLSARNKNLIPWAWGINGCLSVISTAAATVIAVEAGFFYVMLAAALAYLLTLLVNLKS